MSEATLSRRGFLGHLGGAYTAVALLGGTSVVFSALQSLIARHKAMETVWVNAAEIEEVEGTAEATAREREAYRAEQHALKDLLRYRPATLEENAERIAHLRATVWNGSVPKEWEMQLFIESLSGHPVA